MQLHHLSKNQGTAWQDVGATRMYSPHGEQVLTSGTEQHRGQFADMVVLQHVALRSFNISILDVLRYQRQGGRRPRHAQPRDVRWYGTDGDRFGDE